MWFSYCVLLFVQVEKKRGVHILDVMMVVGMLLVEGKKNRIFSRGLDQD